MVDVDAPARRPLADVEEDTALGVVLEYEAHRSGALVEEVDAVRVGFAEGIELYVCLVDVEGALKVQGGLEEYALARRADDVVELVEAFAVVVAVDGPPAGRGKAGRGGEGDHGKERAAQRAAKSGHLVV